MTELTVIDVRCPISPMRLFGKLSVYAEQGQVTVDEQNSISFACDICRNQIRRRGGKADRVIHVYSFLGAHLDTRVETG